MKYVYVYKKNTKQNLKGSKASNQSSFYLRKRPVCFSAFHISMGVNSLDKVISGIEPYHNISNNMKKQMFSPIINRIQFQQLFKVS